MHLQKINVLPLEIVPLPLKVNSFIFRQYLSGVNFQERADRKAGKMLRNINIIVIWSIAEAPAE